jgi:monoamine oxidase
VFWPEEATWIEYVSQPAQVWSLFFNLQKSMNHPILVALNTGEAAMRLENESDVEIISQAMKVLRKLCGKDIPEPLSWEITRWSRDPFSRGSYSHIPVGQDASALDILGEPIGPSLFFAGEATSSKDYASVHAAYLSGLRAAKALIRRHANGKN